MTPSENSQSEEPLYQMDTHKQEGNVFAMPPEDSLSVHNSEMSMHANVTGNTQNYPTSETPHFSVTEASKVNFHPLAAAPDHKLASPTHLSSSVARLVSLVSLTAVVLAPLAACGDTGGSADIPCAIPNSTPTRTPDGTPAATPTATSNIRCTTSSGAHYIWIPGRGGWVSSRDGVHADPNVRGVGANGSRGGSSSGTGEDGGRGGVGSGHGGGDGGGEGG